MGLSFETIPRPPGMGKSYHVHVKHTHTNTTFFLKSTFLLFYVLCATSSLLFLFWTFSWFWLTLSCLYTPSLSPSNELLHTLIGPRIRWFSFGFHRHRLFHCWLFIPLLLSPLSPVFGWYLLSFDFSRSIYRSSQSVFCFLFSFPSPFRTHTAATFSFRFIVEWFSHLTLLLFASGYYNSSSSLFTLPIDKNNMFHILLSLMQFFKV